MCFNNVVPDINLKEALHIVRLLRCFKMSQIPPIKVSCHPREFKIT